MQDQVTQRERLSSRDRALQAIAQDFGQRVFERPRLAVLGWRFDAGSLAACGNNASNSGRRSARRAAPGRRRLPARTSRAARGNSSASARHPSCASISASGQEAKTHQRVMQLVGVARFGPHLFAHARDRSHIKFARDQPQSRVQEARAIHRPACGALQRCIVEIRIWPRRENLQRQRRGSVRSRPTTSTSPRSIAPSSAPGHRCPSPRAGNRRSSVAPMDDRNLAGRDDVLAAGDLSGKMVAIRSSARMRLQLGANLAAALKAQQRQGDHGVPAPARGEHRRREQRLHEQRPHGCRRSSNARRQAAENCAPSRARARSRLRSRPPATRNRLAAESACAAPAPMRD